MAAYGTSQSNRYAADGLRTWKQSAVDKRYFLYDGEQVVVEYNSAGPVIVSTTFGADGADGLVSRHNNNGNPFYLFDERGNVCQRTSSSGAVTSSELYDAYGTRTGTASAPDPFGYGAQAGYYTDTETSLVLCTHRFYDPSNGRWLTRDPIGYAGGINLYGYVGNNPGNRWDPLGYMMDAGTILAGGLRLAGGAELLGGGPVDPAADAAAGAILLGAGILAGGVLLAEKFPPANDPPWMDDPGSLRGRDPGDIAGEIPPEWGPGEPSNKDGGTRWKVPGRDGDGLRILPGNPASNEPIHTGPYCRINKGGNHSDPIPLKGNPVLEEPE